ncbi:hypothetical protein F4859DRAFT_521508 [Xylaria cf. heliscus]|nr:hypothetical protein F4859DRAFT_521508 [Xylaria cf. heliscus]
MATTPLDNFAIQGQQPPINDLPLELALDICETFKSPADMISFALTCPGFLDYWIHFREIIEQRRPHDEDPESNPRAYLPPSPPIHQGPILYDAKRAITFQAYSVRIMNRLFSPEIQRLILLILFMPNPSNRVYDIGYRRQHPQIGNPSPYAILFQRRLERFQRYYIDLEYRDLLFTFKNLNRISPYWTAIEDFATDFAKKALSRAPNWAHHSAPTFAEGVPNWYSLDPNGPRAREFRDNSPIQNLDQLHETERQRLLLAFYQYEAVCASSTKIGGYWEIRRAVDAGINNQHTIDAWNAQRAQQSPLGQQSSCQIERVVTVYYYVRLQYLLLFHSLWLEYCDFLVGRQINSLVEQSEYSFPLGVDVVLPDVFNDKQSLLEWIDILCSRGLLFLHEVLRMDVNQRRDFLVKTYYPTRAKVTGQMNNRDYVMKGFFDALSLRPALNDITTYSDDLGRASEPNLAWLRYNTIATPGANLIKIANFVNETDINLRRTGYVFWNADRCTALGLDDRRKLEETQFNSDNSWGQGLYGVTDGWEETASGVPGWLDSPSQLNHAVGEFEVMNPLKLFYEVTLLEARNPYLTPTPAPLLVEFGILGETWRIGEDIVGGQPLLPNFDFGSDW